jgi:hypothetical protein
MPKKTVAPPARPKKQGAPVKQVESYLIKRAPSTPAPGGISTDLDGYATCPAHAFLKQVCECADAFIHCKNKFTKRADGAYNKDSQDSLEIIANSLLVALMGHFETYQKYLFGGCFERSVYLREFDARRFFEGLKKANALPEIDPTRLAGYRNAPAPIGHILADVLRVWHYPEKVNDVFRSLCNATPFDDPAKVELGVLWQLRHSIAHTAGSLTRPDAEKVPALKRIAGRPIVLKPTGVEAICRKFHKIVKATNGAVAAAYVRQLRTTLKKDRVDEVKAFLAIDSPKADPWLK